MTKQEKDKAMQMFYEGALDDEETWPNIQEQIGLIRQASDEISAVALSIKRSYLRNEPLAAAAMTSAYKYAMQVRKDLSTIMLYAGKIAASENQ